MSVFDPRPVIEWQRPDGAGGLVLCDPFRDGSVPLDPKHAPSIFREDVDTARGLHWLEDPTQRPACARVLGVTAMYSLQELATDGGGAMLEMVVAGSDAYLYAVNGFETIRADTTHDADSFEERIQQLLARPTTPPSTPISMELDLFGPLEAARMTMGDMVDELDEGDPLATLGRLVIADFDQWRQVAFGAAELAYMVSTNPSWREKQGLKIALSAHADDTDITRKLHTFPGVIVGSSDFLAMPDDAPVFTRKELVAAVLHKCVATKEFLDILRVK
ncbi:MAG TPA: hypothetical protein VLH84_00950 [Patescibacteria group bacterium]|nr:hypothetical protein [Patescibacteria group bacterium]